MTTETLIELAKFGACALCMALLCMLGQWLMDNKNIDID
jgi:hypothetical protein